METLIYQMFDYYLDNSKVLDVKAVEVTIDDLHINIKKICLID